MGLSLYLPGSPLSGSARSSLPGHVGPGCGGSTKAPRQLVGRVQGGRAPAEGAPGPPSPGGRAPPPPGSGENCGARAGLGGDTISHKWKR